MYNNEYSNFEISSVVYRNRNFVVQNPKLRIFRIYVASVTKWCIVVPRSVYNRIPAGGVVVVVVVVAVAATVGIAVGVLGGRTRKRTTETRRFSAIRDDESTTVA